MNAGDDPLKLAGRHDHRVDVLAIEQTAIVLHDGPRRFVLGLETLGPRQIAVAQSDDLRVLGELLQQEARPPADADRADANPVVGAHAAGRPGGTRQHERSANRPGRQSSRGSPQKPATTGTAVGRVL